MTTIEIHLYCKSCDRGFFKNIEVDTKDDFIGMYVDCEYCKRQISVEMFMFDDLPIMQTLTTESILNKVTDEEEFWKLIAC
jgi:hypothetical protein